MFEIGFVDINPISGCNKQITRYKRLEFAKHNCLHHLNKEVLLKAIGYGVAECECGAIYSLELIANPDNLFETFVTIKVTQSYSSSREFVFSNTTSEECQTINVLYLDPTYYTLLVNEFMEKYGKYRTE